MAIIHVPRPPKNAGNPNRSVSSLLRAQVDHLHEAEKRLPLRYRSEIYINAIHTEAEAARYIREITEAIHRAHEEAAARPSGKIREVRRGLSIAAVADESAPPKRGSASKPAKKSVSKPAKKGSGKGARKR